MDSFKDLPIQGRVGASNEEILNNIKYNLSVYEANEDIRYYKGDDASWNKYTDCVIVGGGPSARFDEDEYTFFVKHAIPFLTKEVVENACVMRLVVGDPTPLAQVSPHTGEMMDSLFDRLDELEYCRLLSNEVWIAAQSHPSYIDWFVSRGYAENIVLFDLDYPWTPEIVTELSKHHKEQFVPVACGVSSVTCALMLARSLGFATAFLSGVDLYYPDRTEGEFIEIDGKRFYTSGEMLVQAMWLETIISDPDFRMPVYSESGGIGFIAVDNGYKNRLLYSGFEAR